MKWPNFFIIGAPKCGTTTLANWLSSHPQVYMSPVKEPHYFNIDTSYVLTKSEKDYLRLFKNAEPCHKAVGEASVYYAYSDAAIRKIEDNLPGSKYILCIRNPMEMVCSLYFQQVYAGYEDIDNFETAWNSHRNRILENRLPKRCPDSLHIDYEQTCKLGSLIKRQLKVIPRDRLYIMVLDDLKEFPKKEMAKIVQFLELDDFRFDTSQIYNEAKVSQNPWVKTLLRKIGKIKKLLHIYKGFGMLSMLMRLNNRKPSDIGLEGDLLKSLRATFYPEIDCLSELLSRDFDKWKI